MVLSGEFCLHVRYGLGFLIEISKFLFLKKLFFELQYENQFQACPVGYYGTSLPISYNYFQKLCPISVTFLRS